MATAAEIFKDKAHDMGIDFNVDQAEALLQAALESLVAPDELLVDADVLVLSNRIKSNELTEGLI